MHISVECGGFTRAADACLTGNHIAALLTESLSGKLAGHGGMAGDDATSAAFATSYDASAGQAVHTLADLTDSSAGLGRLLAATGRNHERAEDASAGVAAVEDYSGGQLDEGSWARVTPDDPPSSLGAQEPSLGPVDAWILDHVEGFVWPSADVERLRDAATAWRRAAESVAGLDDHLVVASSFVETQRSPEIPLALAAIEDLRGLLREVTEALSELAASCEDYATAVDAAHDRTRGLLKELTRMAVEGVAISAVVGGLTGGLGAAGTGGAALMRISAQSPRFHAILTTLRATAASCAGRLRSAQDGLRSARDRIDKFARIPARDERGAMRHPLGWGTDRVPGWLRSHETPPGHTLREHVGKTTEELRDRLLRSGRSRVSSFDDQHQAERLIDTVLSRHADGIRAWSNSGSTDKLVLDIDIGRPTGTTVLGDGTIVRATGVKVVLIPSKGGDGWQLLTAYPN